MYRRRASVCFFCPQSIRNKSNGHRDKINEAAHVDIQKGFVRFEKVRYLLHEILKLSIFQGGQDFFLSNSFVSEASRQPSNFLTMTQNKFKTAILENKNTR